MLTSRTLAPEKVRFSQSRLSLAPCLLITSGGRPQSYCGPEDRRLTADAALVKCSQTIRIGGCSPHEISVGPQQAISPGDGDFVPNRAIRSNARPEPWVLCIMASLQPGLARLVHRQAESQRQ